MTRAIRHGIAAMLSPAAQDALAARIAAGDHRPAAPARYVAPRNQMPHALMAKTCRDAAAAIVRSEDPDRARAEFIEHFIRTLNIGIEDATENLADIARRAGI